MNELCSQTIVSEFRAALEYQQWIYLSGSQSNVYVVLSHVKLRHVVYRCHLTSNIATGGGMNERHERQLTTSNASAINATNNLIIDIEDLLFVQQTSVQYRQTDHAAERL